MLYWENNMGIGKRGPKTELTGRSLFRRWWSAQDCSAIKEENWHITGTYTINVVGVFYAPVSIIEYCWLCYGRMNWHAGGEIHKTG
jgi:hypothetical protein